MEELESIAKKARLLILESIYKAGSGHLAGSLSVIDILIFLYFGGLLRYFPKEPWHPARDRVILSNGHVCPALYTVLALAGFFPIKTLETLRKLGSPLEGHPIARSLPGIEATTGSLGQGVGIACGIAKALLIQSEGSNEDQDNSSFSTYSSPRVLCILSDGELQEGSVWEAFMFARTHNLRNLIFILDKNGIQNSNYVSQISKLEPLEKKFLAFGLNVQFANGHSFHSLLHAFKKIQAPGIIIANTIAGKGISFLEGDYSWHAKPISREIFEKAQDELKKND